MPADAPVRLEDARLLTGLGRYVGDVAIPDALSVVYVTSTEAHGVLRGVDVAAARTVPGVVAILTAADLDLPPIPPIVATVPAAMARPLLATDRVRFVGEPIAVIVAETDRAAADARDLVIVDIEPLPAVASVDDASSDRSVLFPEVGTNRVLRGGDPGPDRPTASDEITVRGVFVNQRIAPCPLETRAAASRWEPDGRLTHWSSSQGAHPLRTAVATLYGLAPDRVHVIVGDVGGAFGAKARPHPEELLLPELARRTGRAVRWLPSRSADMTGLVHSRAQHHHVEITGTRAGDLRRIRVHIRADAGAYPIGAPLLTANTGALSGGAYHLPEVVWTSEVVVTNTVPIASYRGAGRPEAAALVERAVDLFAAEVGIDPADLRRRNLVRVDEMPFTSATGVPHDGGDYPTAFERALDEADYPALRAEQARRRAAGTGPLLGIGLAAFIDRTANMRDPEYGALALNADGTVTVFTGSTPQGQGHETAWATIVSRRLGLPMDAISVVAGDTDLVPRGGVTGGSKSLQLAGSSVAMAADALVEEARELAAAVLEAAPGDVVLDVNRGGRFHVAGVPSRALGWPELAVARAERSADPLKCEAAFEADAPTVPFGAYVCVVEVDPDTGFVTVVRMVTVDDAGTILHPTLALGQVHGGLGQGLAQGLYEEFSYDDAGNPLTTSFLDYGFPSAADLPSFECTLVETPSPVNPLGARGIAESGTIGAPPAVQNAVVDALAHLGVRHVDLPLTPQRVWTAIRSASA